MAHIGKCLLFYLKYPSEMERLYEAEEPNLDGLPNAEQVLEKVVLVGDAAGREVAELLEACAPAIENHFRPIGAIRPGRIHRSHWYISFSVAPKKTPDATFSVGVSVQPHRGALAAWIWSRGGRRAEDEIVRILCGGVKAAAGTVVLDPGSVGLAEIKIPIPQNLGDPVPMDPLIARVREAFAPFSAREVAAIAAIAGQRRAV